MIWVQILQTLYSLKYRITIRPKESERVVVVDDISDEIPGHNATKNYYFSNERLKIFLEVFAFNYFRLPMLHFSQKMTSCIARAREKYVVF